MFPLWVNMKDNENYIFIQTADKPLDISLEV